MKKVTIYEIANITGVSKSTVSRYLNGGYVSEEKAQLIKKAIEETEFRRSEDAVALRTNRVKAIGVIIPRIDSYSASRIANGIMEVADKNGFITQFISTSLDYNRELDAYSEFEKRNVAGIISVATNIDSELESKLKKMRIPVVVVGQKTEEITCVVNDIEKATKEYIIKLLDYNIKDISILLPKISDKMIERAINIIKEILELKGVKYKLYDADFTWESGYRIAEKAITFSKNIFCLTDNIAYGVYKYSMENNIHIGKDIYVAGIGGYDTSELLIPELTTIKYSQKNAGIIAAKLVIENFRTDDYKLSYRLIITDSWKR